MRRIAAFLVIASLTVLVPLAVGSGPFWP